jgi:cytochrome c oxidase assembly protein subunit 15
LPGPEALAISRAPETRSATVRKTAKPRAIFEEVGARAPAAAPRAGEEERRKARARRWVAGWLHALAALVAAMVLVGGMTRLTDSGLSMVSWHPVMEAMPPLDDAAWAAEFEKYKTTEQYRVVNYWMALPDFKRIYWWEWGHRQFGRVIGLVWAIGLAIFLARRMIPPGYLWPVAVPGLLGAAQAVVGWWMVRSGVEEGSTLVSVAPYRLAVHLGLAFAIFGLLLWSAWRLGREPWALLQARRRRVRWATVGTAALAGLGFAQIVLGAMVAGNDAGRGYVDWPLMNGAILPPEAFDLAPWWRNLVENVALTQFNHRVGAYALGLAALGLWLRAQRGPAGDLRRALGFATAAVWAQGAWGVWTLVNGAPVGLALAHQAGALATLALLVRALFVAFYPADLTVRGGRRAAVARSSDRDL